MNFHLLFLFMCIVAGNNEKEKDSEEDIKRKRIIEQLTKTRTVLLDDYLLVTRQIAIDVFMYRSYRTVSVINYNIITDVSKAQFTFQAEELHLNNIGSCSPQDVVINIKHGSYPALNPDGYNFPKDFIDPSTREIIHSIETLSNGKNRTYTIDNPKPGLVANCRTILYTDLQVKREEDIEIIDCYNDIPLTKIPVLYKCMARDTTDSLTLVFEVNDVVANNTSEFLTFQIQTFSIPSDENYLVYCKYSPGLNFVNTVISFNPAPNSWHYIKIDYINGNASKIADCESYTGDSVDEVNKTVVDLMRDDKGRFFTFDYGLPTTDLQDATSLVNITSNETKSLRFKVNQFLDIGGNLAIEASVLMSLKYFMGYKRQFVNETLLTFTEDDKFFKVVICMEIDKPSIPLETGKCKFNDNVKPALFVLNSTDSDSIYDKVIIPYPESGTWYLTFRLFGDKVVCPCRKFDNGTKYYVETNPSRRVEGTDILANDTREGGTEGNATVVLSISSTSCINGRCSNDGACGLNTFGGLVMSFCSCSAGFGGWDCSDDSRMDTKIYMLVSVLLLTLSNILFLFSIYAACIRYYYTEAMMYAFTMVFSTFYHACDAPAQVAYCIVRGNILQFGDFYCGLMSFWVTLLAMCIITDKLRSSLQLIGAIVVALLTTWNMHSFVSFLLPVAVGVTVLLISWYLDYRKTKRMLYHSSYYRRYFPLGVILVSVGLISYAFLQTEQNYKVVHSLWHMVIAVSVVFLLPDIKRNDANPFVPSPGFCWQPLCMIFRKSPSQ
ncbi:unnamed protein product [Leptidea sinapis]|uniref:EGF-like domain-containing protein n=1 Tax=Leptidea sinapis TaxID=189913 RepID=A0A5E4QSL6_9NEOP|nr:unnamed protein product [Leptidea sinapis]